jgi:hypothetical protein
MLLRGVREKTCAAAREEKVGRDTEAALYPDFVPQQLRVPSFGAHLC